MVTTKLSVCKTKREKKKVNRKKKKKVTKSKIALVDPGSKRRGEGWREWGGWGKMPPSDRQRDEAVVLLDVTFENV